MSKAMQTDFKAQILATIFTIPPQHLAYELAKRAGLNVSKPGLQAWLFHRQVLG